MKKKYIVLLAAIALTFSVVCWAGVGPYSSGSAVLDLKKELENLHGAPYTGREVEGGTEDMEFLVESDTFFLTNYNLRKFFGWDYHYKCHAIYTVYSDGNVVKTTIKTYTGIDPMGHEEDDVRAYLDMENVKGQSSQS